jgi:hypothetical protein
VDRRRCIAIAFGAGTWLGVGLKSVDAKTSELVGRLESDVVAQVLPIKIGGSLSKETY